MRKTDGKNYNAEVDELRAKLAAERKTESQLEKTLERIIADQKRLEKAWEVCCTPGAINGEDPEGAQKLADAENALIQNEKRQRSTEKALAALKQRSEALEREIKPAMERAAETELYDLLNDGVMNAFATIDKGLLLVRAGLEDHAALERPITNLARARTPRLRSLALRGLRYCATSIPS